MTGWGDLVTAAMLGTYRRAVDVAALPAPLDRAAAQLNGDAEEVLLSAAALLTTARRAGVTPSPGPPPPQPAPEDALPVVPHGAAARLNDLLTKPDWELLEQWLHACVSRGRRIPPAALPLCLDVAARHGDLAPAVMRAGGHRAAWLAANRADWSSLASHGAARAEPPQGESTQAVPARDDWAFGGPDQRRAWLDATRRRDPATARRALEEDWGRQTKAERLALLEVLAEGLGPEDEDFLERARRDRSHEVSMLALGLLSCLPRSRMSRQYAAMSSAVLRRERRRQTDRLEVDVAALTAVLKQSDIDVRLHGAHGLEHLLEFTPLQTWIEEWRATPGEILELPVADGWAATLHAGWTKAAVRQRDAAWAAALLAGADAGWLIALLDVIPEAQRAGLVGSRLRGGAIDPTVVVAMLQSCPPPWPRGLSDAVVDWLAAIERSPRDRGALLLIARRLPVEYTGAMARLRAQQDRLSPWGWALGDALSTMAYRRDMLEELG